MPNSRSPRSNSGAVSSDDERGCAGGDASTGGVAAGLAAGAGVSTPAGVFGVTPPGGSRLATLGLAPGLAAAGLSGRRVAELPGLAIAGLSGTTAAGLPGMVPAGLSGTAAAGCGEGAVGAGSKAVAARPAVRSLAPPLAGDGYLCFGRGRLRGRRRRRNDGRNRFVGSLFPGRLDQQKGGGASQHCDDRE